jgi:hypothetical protein
MKPLFTTYTGDGFDKAIDEARRRNPDHRGNVIAIPRGLERLLKVGLEHGQAAALALPFSESVTSKLAEIYPENQEAIECKSVPQLPESTAPKR